MASSVLFVCTGNICRSPIAEGVLRTRLTAAGLDGRVEVDSAGTHGYHVGEPPDDRAVARAARRGYDIAGLRARRLAPEDYGRFDLLLAMDRGHLQIMRHLCPPERADRLALFLDFAPEDSGLKGREVPDPYYGAGDDFERVLDLVEHGCEGLLARLGR